jgi:hypothetical protein
VAIAVWVLGKGAMAIAGKSDSYRIIFGVAIAV